MGRRTKSNVPQDVPLKWNVEKAATEFGLSIMTLRKALNKTSATPDQDGLYMTRQIIAALYGALHQEKVRTQKELADRYMLENQITRAEVLNRSEVDAFSRRSPTRSRPGSCARIWIGGRRRTF
jgi:hypothetical protein